jgi:histidinol phosphatase-like PHP family hydrolase
VAIPRYDFHIHTTYLGCANETMTIPAIVAECSRLGLKTLAITDHLNTRDRLPLHENIRDDILALETEIPVYFGVELNFQGRDGDFAYSAQVRDEMGFQFAIGGIHGTYLDTYDLEALIRIQHRHHLRTCEDPLVQVLVHPYWFPRGEFDRQGWPWFETMQHVPNSMAQELGQASKETGTAIEINACANLVNSNYGADYVAEYVDYLGIIAAEGATFSLASDAHDIGQLEAVTAAWNVAEMLGLSEEQIWRPEGEPLVGG